MTWPQEVLLEQLTVPAFMQDSIPMSIRIICVKNLLFKACENGLFNKISDVEYDESKAEIKSIKNLEFNESSKKYKIKTGGTKNRSVSKSRSNIDRLTKKK